MLGWLAVVGLSLQVTWRKAEYVGESWHDVHAAVVYVHIALERCHTGSAEKYQALNCGLDTYRGVVR